MCKLKKVKDLNLVCALQQCHIYQVWFATYYRDLLVFGFRNSFPCGSSVDFVSMMFLSPAGSIPVCWCEGLIPEPVTTSFPFFTACSKQGFHFQLQPSSSEISMRHQISNIPSVKKEWRTHERRKKGKAGMLMTAKDSCFSLFLRLGLE